MPGTLDSLFSSFNYFEALFHNTKQNTLLLMDIGGEIIAINEAFTNCFGYKTEDVIGKNARMLFTPEDQIKGLPEREFTRVRINGQSDDNNYIVSKDKKLIWVSGEAILVKNGQGEASILKVIQNIQQQKRSEASIQHLSDFNENILSSIEDVVIVLNPRMDIIKANKAFFSLFKHPGPDAETMNFAGFIKPYDAGNDLYDNILHTINTGKGFINKPVEIETAAGEKRIFDLSCSSLENEEGLNNILLVIHDVTIYKQVEREREDIIGFVAHELRNPLANIVLCNEIMSESIKENRTDDLDDLLMRSKNNVMRLNKMIAELYDAAKVNSGHLLLEISTFNFGAMIREAIKTVEVLHPSYNIIVEGEGDITVKGDRHRLIQVVTNYLSNGIKYSNGHTDVVLNMHYTPDRVVVAVKDNGLGISKKHLPHIFERFFRAEKTKNLEGIGLGLYLCRQIIHAHKGQVWAESEEGKGSTFYFSIPIAGMPPDRNLPE